MYLSNHTGGWSWRFCEMRNGIPLVVLKISPACCGTRIGRKKHGLGACGARLQRNKRFWGEQHGPVESSCWAILIFQKNISYTLANQCASIVGINSFDPDDSWVKTLRSWLGYPVQIWVGGTMHRHIVQRCGTSRRSKHFRLVSVRITDHFGSRPLKTRKLAVFVRNMTFQNHSTPFWVSSDFCSSCNLQNWGYEPARSGGVNDLHPTGWWGHDDMSTVGCRWTAEPRS